LLGGGSRHAGENDLKKDRAQLWLGPFDETRRVKHAVESSTIMLWYEVRPTVHVKYITSKTRATKIDFRPVAILPAVKCDETDALFPG
jgi:hypothetical protein